MRLKLATVAVIVMALTVTIGASAFTTGSVSRSSNVNVVTDDVGLIGLSDGTSGGLVYQNSTGALEIDFTKGGANGANTAATFELGNQTDPTNQSAFNITNNDAESHDLTVEYTGVNDGNTDANIQFKIYDNTGSSAATVTDESTSDTITGAASGSTYYVVIVVDTHGLDDTADLSGTLTISA
ncbi:MAG: hypothetical protein ABEJ23_02095 [Haloarculaceae archaeon]